MKLPQRIGESRWPLPSGASSVDVRLRQSSVGAEADRAPAPRPDLSLNTYLAHGSRRGIVWTEQRRLVFRAAWTTDRPFGAYELLKRINEAGGRLHAASVYRCLHLFEAAGLLLPIFSWKRHVLRPALEVDLWAVLLCSNCRSCTLVPLAAEHAATREMLARRGFTGRRYAAECSGLCRSCREGEG